MNSEYDFRRLIFIAYHLNLNHLHHQDPRTHSTLIISLIKVIQQICMVGFHQASNIWKSKSPASLYQSLIKRWIANIRRELEAEEGNKVTNQRMMLGLPKSQLGPLQCHRLKEMDRLNTWRTQLMQILRRDLKLLWVRPSSWSWKQNASLRKSTLSSLRSMITKCQ
jgi:hypothetical protein